MLAIPARYINEQSFIDAALLRLDWSFGFTVKDQQPKTQPLLNDILKQAALWLDYDDQGRIACIPMNKDIDIDSINDIYGG